MTAWHAGPLLGMDVESTGVDVRTDRIVTASLIHSHPATRTRDTSWLLAVEIDIPAEATAIHGITTEHARANGRPPAEAVDVIAADLALALVRGTPVVVFNARFDLTLLECELARYGLPTLAERLDGRIAPIIDPLVLDKAADRYRRGSRRLDAVCGHYGVNLAGAHDSKWDALAAVRLARAIAHQHPDIASMTPNELHTAQVAWAAGQAASLAGYFRRKGMAQEADTVQRAWPIAPVSAPAGAVTQ